MLKGISWGQFLGFMMVAAAIYYLYIGAVYYKTELLGRLRGAGKASGGRADGNSSADMAGSGDSGTAVNRTGSSHEVVVDTEEGRFQLMQRAIAMLQQVIDQAVANQLDRANFLDHIKEVLVEYRQLRRTEYEETINIFLSRVCASELSMHVGDAELKGLWA